MSIIQVTYARTYNLGNYESLRLEAVASADGDAAAAYAEARAAVEDEYHWMLDARDAPPRAPEPAAYAPPSEPPASDAQRRFIATLQDKIGWSSEQLAAWASEQGYDLTTLTKSQASAVIDQLQTILRRPPAVKPGVVGDAELPL